MSQQGGGAPPVTMSPDMFREKIRDAFMAGIDFADIGGEGEQREAA